MVPKLFRPLGDCERIEHGLFAKNPNANIQVAYHVALGSSKHHHRNTSQLVVLVMQPKNFGNLSWEVHRYGNKDIAEIDVENLPDDVKIIDITTASLRNQFKVRDTDINAKFNKFAERHSEVLLTGMVPLSYLTLSKFTGSVSNGSCYAS